MKKLLFIALIGSLYFTSTAQNELLTIKEAVIGQWKELRPTQMHNLQWKGNSNIFTFQDYDNIYSQKLNSNDSTIIVTREKLNSVLSEISEDSLSYIPMIKWETENDFHFFVKTNWYNYNLKTQNITFHITLPKKAKNKSLYYDKKSIAYTIDNNLFLADTSNKPTQITSDIDENIVNGQTVSRNEFSISSGIFWSPKGNNIAFYRKDNSKVENYPLVDINTREAELNNIKYPMAGMSSEHISLGIYSIASGETQFIDKNDTVSEKYLTNISWAPNEENLYIQVLNRAQDHMKMNQYSATSGALIKTLFEEKHDKYVEPLNPIKFIGKNANKFIYQSRKDGFNHAYVYNTDGTQIKQVTKGNWEIIKLLGVDNGYIYYLSTKNSPLERQLYKTSISNGKSLQISHDKGMHKIVAHKSYKYFIDQYSNTETPNKINIIAGSGKIQRQVFEAPNPLLDYQLPEMEIGTIKASDDTTDLYYRLIKPINFDPNKKYPAIVYVYGGPHAQMINEQWLGGARMWQYYMAQKGYVMLTVDNRGSANRGMEFENVIHRQCGVKEMEDQLKGIDFLASLNFVDMDKIGVHGWSYGGFMTTSLMVNHADIYKVGVAGGPVIDWKYYETMYGERYMDSPEDNPEGYLVTSLIPKAKDLKGKLLMIHGGMDPVVVWQHSQLFIQECIKNQVPIDYFIYPNAEHNVRGYHRIHLMDKVSTYFDDYLK